MQFKNSLFYPWLKLPVIWIVMLCGLVLTFSSHLPTAHFFDSQVGYLPLHTAMEFFSIAVDILIFAIVWHTRAEHNNTRNIFLAAVFLGVAGMDFMHTLSYLGMPVFVTPSSPDKAIIFWLAARFLAVMGMLGIVLCGCNIIQKNIGQWLLLSLVVMLVVLMAWLELFYPALLPVTFVPGKGLTQFKINSEYFLSVLYLITALLAFHKSERATHSYWVYLGAAAIIMTFSELFFTWYAKVTDIYNLLGHLYKMIAYGLICYAVFVSSVREPFNQVVLLQKKQENTANKLRVAQTIAHLGEWELDFKTDHLQWSDSVFELFEIEPSRFGASYEAFLAQCHPDDRQKVDENFRASVTNHTPYEFVHRLLMRDGRVKWVRESGVTEYDVDGHPLHTQGVLIEVTHIMEMEESLRSRELYYRTVTELLPVPLAMIDRQGEVTFLNKCFVDTFGYAQADIPNVDQWWALAFPDPDYRASVIRQWTEGTVRMQHGEAFPLKEVRVTCKNGDVRIVIAHLAVLSASENMAFLYDITERKQLETHAQNMREQIAQSSKMESIGYLTAGIAHDFNNILGAMMGYCELSLHMIEMGKPEKLGQYQSEILGAGHRAKELISQMLVFSRLSPQMEAQGMVPVVYLAPVVKEVVSLLRSSIPSTIDLNYRIESDNIKARIQPVHLHQILLNLGVNARDAMGEYGKIEVVLSVAHGGIQLCSSCKQPFDGSYAQISVKDSGSGISEPLLNKIFDPFFTTKEVGKGTGMGLSVVHGLVHALGGHIVVRSSPEGTVFNIQLPLDNAAPDVSDIVDSTPLMGLQGLRVMVVDDESAMSAMLHEFLALHGAHVVSFVSPIVALDSFSHHLDRIDLVITDETMPGMSGMSMASSMLQLKPGLPIILCTGFSEHATPESVANMGIAAFFYKPLNMVELLYKIEELHLAGLQK